MALHEHVHPSRQQNLPNAPERRGKKRKLAAIDTSTKSVNPLKTRIRDLSRELKHKEGLPAHVRANKERELAAHRTDLASAMQKRTKSAMIAKYHKVRFFERQKATRRLKKAKSKLAAVGPEAEDYSKLQDTVHSADVDLNYTMYFPLAQKYLSLYVSAGGKEAASPDEQKPPGWYVVEKAMRNGSLQRLRDHGEMPDATMSESNAVPVGRASSILVREESAGSEEEGSNE